jgi:RES domain-containing protein
LIHDLELVDRLSSFTPVLFDGEVFRAVARSVDALTPSVSGGRWAPKDISVLYTSLDREGALAELAFHWSLFNPLPSRPASLHRIALTTRKTLRFLRADLTSLGVDWNFYSEINYSRTQQIGAAVAFLECDGLIVPSARWSCDNLMIFNDHHRINENTLRVLSTEEIDWITWAREHKLID